MSKSSTITENEGGDLLDPIPPGEILLEDFMKPLGISQNQLARDLAVPVSRVAGIVKGERAITADTAIRLGEYFGTSADVWLGLQFEYELRRARRAEWLPIQSSVIADVAHDGRGSLIVTFVSGKRYAYSGVPPELYAELLAAPSKGAFLNRQIKPRYPAQEITSRSGSAPRSAA